MGPMRSFRGVPFRSDEVKLLRGASMWSDAVTSYHGDRQRGILCFTVSRVAGKAIMTKLSK